MHYHLIAVVNDNEKLYLRKLYIDDKKISNAIYATLRLLVGKTIKRVGVELVRDEPKVICFAPYIEQWKAAVLAGTTICSLEEFVYGLHIDNYNLEPDEDDIEDD